MLAVCLFFFVITKFCNCLKRGTSKTKVNKKLCWESVDNLNFSNLAAQLVIVLNFIITLTQSSYIFTYIFAQCWCIMGIAYNRELSKSILASTYRFWMMKSFHKKTQNNTSNHWLDRIKRIRLNDNLNV